MWAGGQYERGVWTPRGKGFCFGIGRLTGQPSFPYTLGFKEKRRLRAVVCLWHTSRESIAFLKLSCAPSPTADGMTQQPRPKPQADELYIKTPEWYQHLSAPSLSFHQLRMISLK